MLGRLLWLAAMLTLGVCILDPTYFDALKVSPSADITEIREAYQRRKQLLSEETGEKVQKKLELIEEAFKVLGNEEERSKYERYGRESMKHVAKVNRENDVRKGKPINVHIPVSMEQIYKGDNITFSVTKNIACPHCEGYGTSNPSTMKPCTACEGKGFSYKMVEVRNGFKEKVEQICHQCGGVGKLPGKKCHFCKGNKVIQSLETIKVELKKGLPNGNKVILRNMGDERPVGAPADIVVHFDEIQGGAWRRVGKDLHYDMKISFRESIFGLKREIQHLDGRKLSLNLPEGTIITSDAKKVIPNEGLPQKDGRLGNLVINFKISIEAFTEDQLDMWDIFFDAM